MKTIFLLQNGPHILGAYTTPGLLSEAQAEWYDEFLTRFDRTPKLNEIPVVVQMQVDGKQGKSQVVMNDAN